VIPSDPKKIITDLCCRSTKIRFGIISIFHEIKKPISTAEIIAKLKSDFGTSANKTTVYRQLDFLVEKEIVSAIDIDGTKLYQLNKKQPHQILVCSNCHEIISLDNEISLTKAQIQKLETVHHFKINHYSFICFGNCQKCQK
jgi:Fur family transcriptional regulator, ferric uptake regulator